MAQTKQQAFKNPFAITHSDLTPEQKRCLIDRFKPGIIRWATQGELPGSFLASVLANDLRSAVSHADALSALAIPVLVRLLWNTVPSPCWGSNAAVNAWSGTDDLTLRYEIELDVNRWQG